MAASGYAGNQDGMHPKIRAGLRDIDVRDAIARSASPAGIRP
jgi:hypothetical protein